MGTQAEEDSTRKGFDQSMSMILDEDGAISSDTDDDVSIVEKTLNLSIENSSREMFLEQSIATVVLDQSLKLQENQNVTTGNSPEHNSEVIRKRKSMEPDRSLKRSSETIQANRNIREYQQALPLEIKVKYIQNLLRERKQWKKVYPKFLKIDKLPQTNTQEREMKNAKMEEFLAENFDEFEENKVNFSTVCNDLLGEDSHGKCNMDDILDQVLKDFNKKVEDNIEKTYKEKYGVENIRTIDDRKKYIEEILKQSRDRKIDLTKENDEEARRIRMIKKHMVRHYNEFIWSPQMFGFGKRAEFVGFTDEDGYVL